MIRNVVAGILAFSFATISFATPRPNEIEILHVSADGTGCPGHIDEPYWTATRPGGPADYFEVVFNDFSVSKGPGIDVSEARKFCTISVDMKIPQGWSYSLLNVAYEGYGDIPRGYQGMQKSTYQFPQHSNRVSARSILRGPYNGSYDRTDSIGVRANVWSPCGLKVPLHIKAELQLRGYNSSRQSYMTVDEVTGKLRQIWGVQWKRCR